MPDIFRPQWVHFLRFFGDGPTEILSWISKFFGSGTLFDFASLRTCFVTFSDLPFSSSHRSDSGINLQCNKMFHIHSNRVCASRIYHCYPPLTRHEIRAPKLSTDDDALPCTHHNGRFMWRYYFLCFLIVHLVMLYQPEVKLSDALLIVTITRDLFVALT